MSCCEERPRRHGDLWQKGVSVMTRRPRDLTFRSSDLVRAVKASATAGLAIRRVEITKTGTITIVPERPEAKSERASALPPAPVCRVG
jgi:hypothetical protein